MVYKRVCHTFFLTPWNNFLGCFLRLFRRADLLLVFPVKRLASSSYFGGFIGPGMAASFGWAKACRDIPADREIPLGRNRDVVLPSEFFLLGGSTVASAH
jgi:hypothetical protein